MSMVNLELLLQLLFNAISITTYKYTLGISLINSLSLHVSRNRLLKKVPRHIGSGSYLHSEPLLGRLS